MTIQNEDIEYMSDTSAAVLQGASLPAHIILWSAATFIVCAILWANFAVLDEITRGEGKVIPSSDIQKIQSLEGGIVEQILVSEGQIVEKGEILMTIDDTQFSSSFKENLARYYALQAKVARLQAEAEGVEPIFPEELNETHPQIVEDEMDLYETRKNENEVRVNILEDEAKQKSQELAETERKQEQLKNSFDLVHKELELTRPLAKNGAVSEVELLRLERTVNDMRGEMDGNELAIPRLKSAVLSAKRKIKETQLNVQARAQEELNAAKAELAGITESSEALKDKVTRTDLRSPVRGTVNQINNNTVGGIIQPGADVMEVVPLDDTLLIEAEIQPKDIGFVRPGLKAMVKLTAYDFSIYGGLSAKVEHISANTVLNEKKENVYQIRLRTDKNFLEKNNKKFNIITGMRASVDILTGKKTVLDYLMKPILKTKQVALSER